MTQSAAPERILPHNLEAERSVLGAVLLNNDAFNHATEVIDARDFFRDAHRQIFEAMIALSERSQPIDLVTLKDELTRRARLDDAGGPAYVAALVDGVPRAVNVAYYARIVKEKSTLRSLISASMRILDEAYEAEQDADDLLDRAEEQVFAIAENRIREGFLPLRAIVHQNFDVIEKLHTRGEIVTGVPSGFVDLDLLTSGFQKSDLVIVAARPSMGKTSFVLNIAQHVGVRQDRTVGFFSLEMSREQLFLRMLTAEARIDAQRLRRGQLGDADYGRIITAMGVLADARIFIDDSAAIGALEMRAKARRLKKEHGLDLLIIDYLQLMQARGRFDNRTQEIGSISRSLKILAKELNLPIIALSQLSRAPEARADHRPQLSDLRESGALEQDADVVLFIFREDRYQQTPSPESEGVAEIIVGKQRNGPTGVVKLAFLKEYTRFENLDRYIA
jgi:replicative DNA helicase